MAVFVKSLINTGENNFSMFSNNGRRRVLTTALGLSYCGQHARELGDNVTIETVTFVDKKPSRFCVVCSARQAVTDESGLTKQS